MLFFVLVVVVLFITYLFFFCLFVLLSWELRPHLHNDRVDISELHRFGIRARLFKTNDVVC